MITGDKGKNRQRAPAAHRVVKNRSSRMNDIDKNTEGQRKKPPVTVAHIPSLDRPLPPEDRSN
jgi:hypothetical protein